MTQKKPAAIKKRTKFILTILAAAFVIFLITYDFPSERELEKQIDHLYSVDDPQFLRSMGQLVGPAFVSGNRVQTLLNGDQVFPAMLNSIREAQRTITMESYIYWSGKTGEEFSKALIDRAQNGVRVHLLLDSVGAGKLDKSLLKKMTDAGVQVQHYHPVLWFTITRLNNRTHRKIMVVDGKVGFTGGLGIADQWLGNAEGPGHWRDTHFKVEGPVVGQLQAVFMQNWMKTSGELLDGENYFPKIDKKGDQLAQVSMSSANEGSENARLMYLLAIACAQKNILMSNAYFVPDALSVQTLVAAARRGVHIRIIAPGKVTDTKFVRRASRSRWGDLLKAGIEIYEYQPTMFHCKVMVVDGLWSAVGSTNFDNRSFRLNDEVNLNVVDRGFASEQADVFQDDLAHSTRITYEGWKNRPITEKLKEFLAGLFKNQL